MGLSISRSSTITGVVESTTADISPWCHTACDATVLMPRLEVRGDLFDLWIRVPESASRPAPSAQRLAQELLLWTGWSHRSLAAVLGISHPTVAALVQGKSSARVGDLFARLIEAHEVVQRVYLIADKDAPRARRLLSATSKSGYSVRDLLAQRQPAAAYLAALDASGPLPVGPMMQSIWPSSAGNATVDLAEDPM